MPQYQIHFRIMGIWCAQITPDGTIDELAVGVRSLQRAKKLCEKHHGQPLEWHSINGHFTGVTQ